MNIDMTRPRKKTEEFLLSIPKICETPNRPTHRQPQETLESKLTQPTDNFSFKPLISIEGYWVIGLRSLEMYKSICDITEKK